LLLLGAASAALFQSWELTGTGMTIGLGKEIPDAIYKYIDCQTYTRAAHRRQQQLILGMRPNA